MRFCKRASLNLSINAIVILILAITMLGLGLGFMKNLFSKTTGQLADVGEDIKNQMISELRRSNSKLTLDQEDITMKAGSSKDIYFGVKNVLSPNNPAGIPFQIIITCQDALDGSPALMHATGSADGEVRTFEQTRELGNGEIDVQKMQLSIPSTFTATTWPCKLTLNGDADGTFGTMYTAKSFFVTVEK